MKIDLDVMSADIPWDKPDALHHIAELSNLVGSASSHGPFFFCKGFETCLLYPFSGF